jgi:YbbR domain-containing protein
MLTKNALWIAISSTIAAICLFTSIMNYENGSRVENTVHEQAQAAAEDARDKLAAQDAAAQAFSKNVSSDLRNNRERNNRTCASIDAIINGKRAP